LITVERRGLPALGVLNGALLLGAVGSVPATALLAKRRVARELVRLTGIAEIPARGCVLVLLLADASLPLIALAVLAMGTMSWARYAGSRALAGSLSRSYAQTLTAYIALAGIAEAGGTAAAALLPGDPPGSGQAVVPVAIIYLLGPLPLYVAAGAFPVNPTTGFPMAERVWGVQGGAIIATAAIMLVAAGPTWLAIGIAAQLYGPRWVTAVALAEVAGTMLAPWAVMRLRRARLADAASWPLLGCGMLIGWVLAPVSAAGLVAAKLLSSACLTAFEGSVDSYVSKGGTDDQAVTALAITEAARALGAAAAVVTLPQLVSAQSVGTFSATMAALLLLLAAVLRRHRAFAS
jgi:hypothetical protein